MENKNWSVFHSITDGFSINKVVFNDFNQPVDYVFLDVNDNFAKILGKNKQDIIGKTIFELYPDISENWLNSYKDLVLNKKNIKEEKYSPLLDKHFRITAAVVDDLIMTMVFDITETVKNTKELIKYKYAIDNAGDAILFFSSDGKILEANDTAINYYGYSKNELLHMSVYDLRDKKENKIMYDEMQYAFEKGILFETVHIKKDGSRIPVYANSKRIPIDNTEILISIIRDISNLKLQEKEILDLYIALEQSSSTIMILDANGVIEYVNKPITNLTGYLPTELKGETINIFHFDEDNFDIYSKLKDVITSKKPWSGEILKKKKNGDPFWSYLSIYPSISENGNIIKLVATIDDITDKVMLKEQLTKQNLELQKTFKDLETTEQRLMDGDKLANIGQLSAGIAHEINNPLGFVMGNFEALKKYIYKFKSTIEAYRELKKKLDTNTLEALNISSETLKNIEDERSIDFMMEDLNELFKDTEDGLERVRKIVMALRMFSRENQDKSFEQYDINMGIENTLLIAKNEFKYTAEVETNFGDVPIIDANSGQINQVLLNLIINASHAIKEKTNNLKLGLIKISTYADDNFVYCSIEDTGKGIAEENLSKIFKPFFTTKPVGIGTGLGLSICNNIIKEKHKGDITVQSVLNEGTTITFKLPIHQEIKE